MSYKSTTQLYKQLYNNNLRSGGMADLANAWVVHPRNLGSNLGVNKIFSDSVCVSFEFKSVEC